MPKTCFVIVGPTASGKTSFAIRLAKHFKTSIISADSRQCFKELNIGVAKPTQDELSKVPHYFINSHSINNELNAAFFEQYALKKINQIFIENDVAIVVGGTGLYINAFCHGIDEVPPIPPSVRENIVKGFEEFGLDWLQNEIKKNDPEFFVWGEIKNPQRMMRALEVIQATGKSILTFQKKVQKKRDFTIINIGMELPRQQLYENINARVDAMMQTGLLKEVTGLSPYKHLNALQTVGYRELFSYLAGEYPLEVAVEKIKTNTRQYAKRQLTWFKRDVEIKWVNPLLPVLTLLEEISWGK